MVLLVSRSLFYSLILPTVGHFYVMHCISDVWSACSPLVRSNQRLYNCYWLLLYYEYRIDEKEHSLDGYGISANCLFCSNPSTDKTSEHALPLTATDRPRCFSYEKGTSQYTSSDCSSLSTSCHCFRWTVLRHAAFDVILRGGGLKF